MKALSPKLVEHLRLRVEGLKEALEGFETSKEMKDYLRAQKWPVNPKYDSDPIEVVVQKDLATTAMLEVFARRLEETHTKQLEESG